MFIDPKPIHNYPWYVRLFFWKQKKTYGAVLDPGLLWARSPLVFSSVALLYGALNRKSSPLPPALRSLVTVRISQINHCEFCVDVNAATLLKHGADEAKVLALNNWRESDLFDDTDCLALDYAETITYTERTVTPAQREKLKATFDDDAIVELTGLIAFQNLSSKFNSALDVPSQGFCQIPVSSV